MAEDGVFRLDVIGGGKPKGICGTGIFDLVAECYRYGIINGDGSVNMDRPQYVTRVWDENAQESLPAVVYGRNGDEKLYFTQRDIQEFVRCKAAGFTMVATLLDYCGLSLSDVGKFYLAGGFGTHIDLESAITVGLYPDVERGKLVPLGNTSLQGAKRLLLDTSCLKRLDWFRQNGIYLHFGGRQLYPPYGCPSLSQRQTEKSSVKTSVGYEMSWILKRFFIFLFTKLLFFCIMQKAMSLKQM